MSLQDVQDYRDSLQQLYNSLDQWYWSPGTPGDAKDAIYSINTAISPILTMLNQILVASDTTQLAALKASVDAVNAQMTKVQKQVNTWIKDVALAGQIGGLLDKALALALKVFVPA